MSLLLTRAQHLARCCLLTGHGDASQAQPSRSI
jgi:hypothetical protein